MKRKRTFGTPRLLGIVWPFIAVVLFQALLGCGSLYVLSAVRGYVGGESLWSKGQKDAIYYHGQSSVVIQNLDSHIPDRPIIFHVLS